MLSKLSNLVVLINAVKACQMLPSLSSVFQIMSKSVKCWQEWCDKCCSNFTVTSHIIYNTRCQCFAFVNTSQTCSMSNRFSRCMRNIQIWSGAEVCRSCRSRKMPKKKHLLETFGFDIVESEPSEFSKSAYDMCSWWHPQGSECESHKIEIVFKNRRHRSRLGCRRGRRDRRWGRGRHLRDASFLAFGWIYRIANTNNKHHAMLTKRVCHRNSQTWSSAHQCGQSLSNVTKLGNCFFNNCQSLSNDGKNDVTNCLEVQTSK